MSKNQNETIKFPRMKVILSVVLACLFGFAAPFVETFTQNNVQTALVIAGLKNGSNAVATYTASLPYIAAVTCVLIAIIFVVIAVSLVVKYYKDKAD